MKDIKLNAEQRATAKLWAYKIVAADLEHQMRGAPKVYLSPDEASPGALMEALTPSGKPLGENTGLDMAITVEAYKIAAETFQGLVDGATLVKADVANVAKREAA